MGLSKIVVISRDAETQQLAQRVGSEIFVADDLKEALETIETVSPDLILLDHCFTSFDINAFFDKLVTKTDIPVIVAGNIDDPYLFEKFKEMGAYDYINLQNDFSLEQIVSRINNDPKTIEASASFFVDEFAESVQMAGLSPAIFETFKMIKLVAASQCNPVLIVGETGTGKELAAKAVHNLRHPNEPFIAVNCAALTANLLESELFGHTKGSFTSADQEKTGLLECAGKGTIFLDEISEMPLDLQAKLLRVLQEKTFRKVGGTKNISCNATIIASSNRNLAKESKSNRFRMDLYYRLNICPITIPPLRSQQRQGDITVLAEYFLKTSNMCPDKAGKIKSFTKLALEELKKHNWPGNIRELKNIIERAILVETTDKIGTSSIIIDNDSETDGQFTSSRLGADLSLEKAEHELIIRALQQTGWQKTQAASLLGITRATLYAKVKQYNIEKSPSSKEQSEYETLSEVEIGAAN